MPDSLSVSLSESSSDSSPEPEPEAATTPQLSPAKLLVTDLTEQIELGELTDGPLAGIQEGEAKSVGSGTPLPSQIQTQDGMKIKVVSSRILEESSSWRQWLSADNWLRAFIYAMANLWCGYTTAVRVPLTATFMQQCDVGASGVSMIFVTSAVAYLLGAFANCALQLKNAHIQFGTAMILSSVPLYFMKLPHNIWLLSLLWFVQGIGRGVNDASLASFAFQMTMDDSGDIDTVFGALLMQSLSCFYGFGMVLAPLSVQISEKLANSYAPALFVFASFGILVAMALLFTKSPPIAAKAEDETATGSALKKSSIMQKSINVFGKMANNMQASVPLSLSFAKGEMLGENVTIRGENERALNMQPQAIPSTFGSRMSSALHMPSTFHMPTVAITVDFFEEVPFAGEKTRWHTIVASMACFIVFFNSTFASPLNAFIGDYSAEHLHMNASVGRFLNTAFFAAQLSGGILWMFPMRLYSTTHCLAVSRMGVLFAGALMFAHALATSNGAHSWVFYVCFVVAGFFAAPIITLSLRFVNAVMGSEPIWGAIVLALYSGGDSVGTVMAGACIDKFGYYSLPYYLLGAAVSCSALLLAIAAIDRMYVRAPKNEPQLSDIPEEGGEEEEMS